jgi:hypothetical protein
MVMFKHSNLLPAGRLICTTEQRAGLADFSFCANGPQFLIHRKNKSVTGNLHDNVAEPLCRAFTAFILIHIFYF